MATDLVSTVHVIARCISGEDGTLRFSVVSQYSPVRYDALTEQKEESMVWLPCGACGSTGNCPNCGGSGSRGRERCTACGGSGNCVTCGGSGQLNE